MSNQQRPAALQIHGSDNVCVVLRSLQAGVSISVNGQELIPSVELPLGAKLAMRDIAFGEKIIKFGEPIGVSTAAIARGEWVHTHNIRSDYLPTHVRQKPPTKAPVNP